jgi:hypothetical protein
MALYRLLRPVTNAGVHLPVGVVVDYDEPTGRWAEEQGVAVRIVRETKQDAQLAQRDDFERSPKGEHWVRKDETTRSDEAHIKELP